MEIEKKTFFKNKRLELGRENKKRWGGTAEERGRAEESIREEGTKRIRI